MKWCFKCGKFGHLYCNVQYPNEKAFFYEYEHINSDDESSTKTSTNKHKRNNNYHNTDVLVNVKESLLMNDNNFFDSADNIII
jgi:hypothetical protein